MAEMMKKLHSQETANQKAPFYHIEVAQKAFAKELAHPTNYKRRAGMLPNNDPRKGELLRLDKEQVVRMTPENAARQEILHDLLERLTRTVVENTEIVHGENGEAFPVSHVNIPILPAAFIQTHVMVVVKFLQFSTMSKATNCD